MLTADSTELERFQDALGYRFRDPVLLTRCLTHISCGGVQMFTTKPWSSSATRC